MRRLVTVESAAVVAAACIAIYILFIGPFIGVADNGDFLRIMGTVGLNYYDAAESFEDRFFGYAHANFAYDSFFQGAYVSTQIILVFIARFAGMIANSDAFDIRVLGAIYTLLLLAAVYLIIRHNKTESRVTGIVLAACIVFVFCDIAYLAYFNSFFGEPVSFVFMLLTFGLGLWLTQQERPSNKVLVLFFVSVVFLSFSKIQNAPIGVAFALIGLRYMSLKRDMKWRKIAMWFSIGIFLTAVIMYITAPKDLKHINLYQTVFFGILNGSPDVEGDLEELGLPDRLSVLAGTNFFQTDTAIKQDDPSLKADFYDRISHTDVLLFYLKHPGRLIDKMEYAASNGMSIRPYYLGNYEKAEGKPSGTLSMTYSTWSEFKNKYLPRSLLFIVIFYVLYFAAALFEYMRRPSVRERIAIELFMLIGLVGIFAFLVPILGDGQADMGKHLFLFNVSFDMMLVTAVVWVVYQLASLKRSRRRSYYY
ncbi:glycan biosynthesis hexose transferase WsfD [Paenibacillus spongiae]|uniref:Transmembrane protein n=1 Tax=Paenibacillus spongiae TaxID=2909671 RepID=A0ABY5S7U2_9BACL|nr:hypothetical protein [Paenibacillus spongiae]UVI28902.1 hypothetical protein L1F29_26200 [Paenibacillus spongiae]